MKEAATEPVDLFPLIDSFLPKYLPNLSSLSLIYSCPPKYFCWMLAHLKEKMLKVRTTPEEDFPNRNFHGCDPLRIFCFALLAIFLFALK